MFCFNIPRCNLTEAADIVFPSSMLVPCWFTVFVFWLGHSTPKCQAWFWMFFCFEVVNQRENYKWTTFYCEMLSSRMGCTRLLTLCSRFAHVLLTLAHALLTLCSRFAHALLTLCSGFAQALLTLAKVPFESFRFLLSPYEVPFGSLRGSAHGLLAVCSRFAHGCLPCSRFADALGDDVSILVKKPISKPCHFFVVPSHVYLRHTAFRLQTPWGWFSNLKKAPTCHSQPFAEAGLPHPCLRYICATFLLSPKDSESTSDIMILWHVPL